MVASNNSYNFIDLTGKQFGLLTVLRRVDNDKWGNPCWICQCACGNTHITQGSCLRSGSTMSCGCKRRQNVTTHGLSKSPLYRIWKDLKSRLGCSMCEEWLNDFQVFYDFCINNGWKQGLCPQRIDRHRIFSQLNCCFVTWRISHLHGHVPSNNTSGYIGVTWHKLSRKWRARIMVHGSLVDLGYHNTEDEACVARDMYIIDNNMQQEYKVQILNEELT